MYNGHNKIALLSQEAIKKAFLHLLQEESFDKITISELCKEAEVSRQTFYSLYQKKENILIYELRNNYPFSVCDHDLTLKDLSNAFSLYLTENYEFIKIIIENGYANLLYQTFYHSLVSCHCTMRDEAAIRDEYFASFMAGGLMSITKKYVDDEGKDSHLEEITYDLFSGRFFR